MQSVFLLVKKKNKQKNPKNSNLSSAEFAKSAKR